VRLTGLHVLERLAQNTPEQRQTIVDVICAYLRMSHTPAGKQPPGWTTRPAEPDNGEDPAFLYLVRMEESNPPDT
jgi:hypothetical protein